MESTAGGAVAEPFIPLFASPTVALSVSRLEGRSRLLPASFPCALVCSFSSGILHNISPFLFSVLSSWVLGKDPDAEKDWGQEEKGRTEDEVVRWHHRLNGHELSKLQGMVKDRWAWHAAVHGVVKSQMQLSDWTTATYLSIIHLLSIYHLSIFAPVSTIWSKGKRLWRIFIPHLTWNPSNILLLFSVENIVG